jgi:hypothetical protein
MGFEGYGLSWAFFHKEVVAESTGFVLPRSVGFLRKECSKRCSRHGLSRGGMRISLKRDTPRIGVQRTHFVPWRHVDFLEKGCSTDWVQQTRFVPWRHVDFLEKGCSKDWVQQTRFVLVVDGGLRLEVAPQHEGAPRMEFVLRWEDAPQFEVEFPRFEG